MRAMVVPRYGGPEVFELREVPEPVPGRGEVSIDVDFVAVNFSDIRNRRGDALGVPPFIPGIEVSGRIRGLGEGSAGFEVGEPVTAATLGHGYAEVAKADARRVFRLPESLVGDPASGALTGVVPSTIRLLRYAARPRPDETMLIHGASGGVGTALVQVAQALGLGRVYGTVGSHPKLEYASGYPFAGVFLRDRFVEEVMDATNGRGVEIVLDPIGGRTRARSFEALAPFGRLVHFGNASMEPEEAPDALTMRARGLGYVGYSVGQHVARDPEGTLAEYEEGIQMVADGRVRLDVTAVYPLEEAAAVHRAFEERTVVGKVVLAVSEAARSVS